ncbi:Early nodulin-93 [Morella rubra]|uniref:Early nodulin-93 n=1 Tax=Morella rubra TaxID=262757 RepID=A0A6A1V854_9ROSI|nr:Early nodulin-93 [Morella rubra]
MLPWARANLNHTAQALIISTVAGAAYFIVAERRFWQLLGGTPSTNSQIMKSKLQITSYMDSNHCTSLD